MTAYFSSDALSRLSVEPVVVGGLLLPIGGIIGIILLLLLLLLCCCGGFFLWWCGYCAQWCLCCAVAGEEEKGGRKQGYIYASEEELSEGGQVKAERFQPLDNVTLVTEEVQHTGAFIGGLCEHLRYTLSPVQGHDDMKNQDAPDVQQFVVTAESLEKQLYTDSDSETDSETQKLLDQPVEGGSYFPGKYEQEYKLQQQQAQERLEEQNRRKAMLVAQSKRTAKKSITLHNIAEEEVTYENIQASSSSPSSSSLVCSEQITKGLQIEVEETEYQRMLKERQEYLHSSRDLLQEANAVIGGAGDTSLDSSESNRPGGKKSSQHYIEVIEEHLGRSSSGGRSSTSSSDLDRAEEQRRLQVTNLVMSSTSSREQTTTTTSTEEHLKTSATFTRQTQTQAEVLANKRTQTQAMEIVVEPVLSSDELSEHSVHLEQERVRPALLLTSTSNLTADKAVERGFPAPPPPLLSPTSSTSSSSTSEYEALHENCGPDMARIAERYAGRRKELEQASDTFLRLRMTHPRQLLILFLRYQFEKFETFVHIKQILMH